MRSAEPSDDCSLLRMVWSPSCFDGGRPTSACFDSKDLLPDVDGCGRERFVSVDLMNEVREHVLEHRIHSQSAGEKRERLGRHEARFLVMRTGDIRTIPCRNGASEAPLIVQRDPIKTDEARGIPGNTAHCAVRRTSASRPTGKAEARAYVEYLRKELLKRVLRDHAYEEVFSV